jgi:hypothetical protein
MITETLVTHAMAANVTANLFLFQMAMLNASINALILERWPWLGRMEGDAHAKNNQEGSADKAHVGKDLENIAKRLPPKDQKITHKLDRDQGLRTVTSRGKGNKCEEADSDV